MEEKAFLLVLYIVSAVSAGWGIGYLWRLLGLYYYESQRRKRLRYGPVHEPTPIPRVRRGYEDEQ